MQHPSFPPFYEVGKRMGKVTDSDEDLIFVPKRPTTFTIDQEKRLALQKDIDQESQPRKPAKHLACQRMVALEMKKEVAVANSDGQTEKMEKKEKRRKATQPEREVISNTEESEGGVKKERKKKKNAEVKIEETSNQDRGAKTEKMTHNDTAKDTFNHDVKDIHGFSQETSKKTKKALAKVETEENGGKIARSVKEEVAEGKKQKMKNKSVQSERPVEYIKVEDGEKVGAEEEVQKKVKKKKKVHDGHIVKDMNGNGQETSKKKKKTYSAKVEAEENGGKVVCTSVKEEGSEGKEQRKKKKMKNKSVQSEPPVENIKVEDGEEVGAEKEVLKKAKKKKKKKGQIVALAACSEGTKELMKGTKKGKKRISALAELDEGEGMSAKKKKMVKKELVEDEKGFIIPKVEVGAAEGETVKKKKRRKKAAKMEGEEPLEEAETLEVKHQVKKKRKIKKDEAATQEGGEVGESQHTNNRDKVIGGMDRNIEEVKTEQESKKKGLKEKSEKKGLKEKSEKKNKPKEKSEKKKGSKEKREKKGLKEKSEKKKGSKEKREKKRLKEKKRKAPVSAEEEQEVSIVEEGEPKAKRKKKRGAVLSIMDEEMLDQSTEVSGEDQSGELLTTVAGGMKGKKKKRKNLSGVEIKVEQEEEAGEGDGKKRKMIKVEQCDSEKQQGQEVASHTDVVFLSKKNGNKDEVTINQQRRLALQMEVDKASQPPTGPTGLGQWASAQFDSSDQQQKFLRLMGGFKKGAQPAGSIAGRANMAMGKEGQDRLQQALQGQFEQAQSRRIDFNNKGSGLGFSAPSNKKFAIDVDARRSVRFDD